MGFFFSLGTKRGAPASGHEDRHSDEKHAKTDERSVYEQTLKMLADGSRRLVGGTGGHVHSDSAASTSGRPTSTLSSAAGKCRLCEKGEPSAACAHCDRALCTKCYRFCDGCQQLYCSMCSIPNYDQPQDRAFCLDCSASDGPTAMCVQEASSSQQPSASGKSVQRLGLPAAAETFFSTCWQRPLLSRRVALVPDCRAILLDRRHQRSALGLDC
eukprot:jgi/Chlat1/4827/Chrsp31S04800